MYIEGVYRGYTSGILGVYKGFSSKLGLGPYWIQVAEGASIREARGLSAHQVACFESP